MSKFNFHVFGSDECTAGMICIPEIDTANHYLCTDGKVYSWPTDKKRMENITFFNTEAEANAVLNAYNGGTQRSKIAKLKSMVKELRRGFKPELIVELYNFVESM